MKPITRSPLKAAPLRNPGQSLDERLQELLYDKLLTPFMMATMLIVMAALEWWGYFHPGPRQPLLYTIFALLGTAYLAFRWKVSTSEIRRVRLARNGEKVVGQYLERLREQGYQVFHDVIGEGFNIDHVLIGPAGVFTVETKTYSKPAHGDAVVVFDGAEIRVGGYKPERDPVRQAKAQAKWVKTLLLESTGKEFKVRPVIVFPGWFVKPQVESGREIWILEPKALPSFLVNEAKSLSPEDVKLASFHLSRFIRAGG